MYPLILFIFEFLRASEQNTSSCRSRTFENNLTYAATRTTLEAFTKTFPNSALILGEISVSVKVEVQSEPEQRKQERKGTWPISME